MTSRLDSATKRLYICNKGMGITASGLRVSGLVGFCNGVINLKQKVPSSSVRGIREERMSKFSRSPVTRGNGVPLKTNER